MTAPILVLGNVNVDLVLGPVDGWPTVGTEIEVERAEKRAGGSAGNTALALGGLGEPHLMVASTGDDSDGDWLRGQFEATSCDWIEDRGATTLTVGIVHKGGDRAFFTTPGHLQRATAEQMLARIPSAPEPGAVAILSGNLLMPQIAAATTQILRETRARGWSTALDPGWPPQGWSAALRALFADWLSLTDHALLNDEELSGLADGQSAAAVAALLPQGGTLVVKRGVTGAIAYRDGFEFSVAAPPVEVIETVGAGDTFNAAYLASVVRRQPLAAALASGVAVASRAISTYPRRYA